MASYPPSLKNMEAWFATHEDEWSGGSAYRFAVSLEGRMIGLVDIDEIVEGSGELGYWLDKMSWGNGFAYEAAEALVRGLSGILCLRP
jgi:RimJ/RimL family protein N-acetyltransferase